MSSRNRPGKKERDQYRKTQEAAKRKAALRKSK